MIGLRTTARSGNRARGRGVATIGAGLVLLASVTACDPAEPAPPSDEPTTATSEDEAAPAEPTGASTVFTAADLGVELTLPADFVERPSELPLTVERADPRTILSIDGFGASVPIDDYPAQPGEDVTTTTVDGVDVLVIVGSQVDGLPPGIEANTLIADNGDRSFSLIMSAAPEDLAEAWDHVLAGISLTP